MIFALSYFSFFFPSKNREFVKEYSFSKIFFTNQPKKKFVTQKKITARPKSCGPQHSSSLNIMYQKYLP